MNGGLRNLTAAFRTSSCAGFDCGVIFNGPVGGSLHPTAASDKGT